MRRRNNYNRNREKKERLIMLGSAVFVLTALTMTGVYVKGNNEKNKNDGYTIDFSSLQDDEDEKEKEIAKQTTPSDKQSASTENTGADRQMAKSDANTTNTKNYQGSGMMPGKTNVKKPSEQVQDDFMDYLPGDDGVAAEAPVEEEPEFAQAAEFSELNEDDSIATDGEAVANFNQPELQFSENDSLTWPIVGNVLINYSMDKTTYFATLQQYKYSPAIVIAASEGEAIGAAANGRVIDIYEEEIGKAVVMDLGGGYQLTYGQLEDIQVSKGGYVSTGEIVGNVAAPTKYYSVEGANVYFKLTKDGTPVNPMGKLD